MIEYQKFKIKAKKNYFANIILLQCLAKYLGEKKQAYEEFHTLKLDNPVEYDDIYIEAHNLLKLCDRSKEELENLRRDELIKLSLNNIFLDEDLIKVVGKRNKERLVPILPTLKEKMAKYLEIRNEKKIATKIFFITSRGKQIGPSLVYRVVKKYFSKASSKVKKSPQDMHLSERGVSTYPVVLHESRTFFLRS